MLMKPCKAGYAAEEMNGRTATGNEARLKSIDGRNGGVRIDTRGVKSSRHRVGGGE